jgi:hypothetical protein
VFGYIKLKKASYLILIEEASIVGLIMRGTVYRVEKLMFLPLCNTASMHPDRADVEFIDMIQKIQAEKAFYFSYDLDLTQNLQRTVQQIQAQSSKPQEGNMDTYIMMRDTYPNSIEYLPHFAFNHSLLYEFRTLEYSPFRIPCIFGYVYTSSVSIKPGELTDFNLVSRKDCMRPGRRFITRGLDQEGNAANFVETEQIFVHHTKQGTINVASYV